MGGRGRAAAAAAAAFVALIATGHARAANPQVAGLQVALRAYGLYLGPIDGRSGPLTAAAIRSFQARRRLPVDGIAGARTRAKLGPLGRPLFGRRTIARGAFGWDVSVLQFLLHRRGLYAGAFDGYAGPETVRALRRYQRQAGLAADGIAGPVTTAALVRQLGVPVSPAPAAPQAVAQVHVVRAGENLTLIAQRFGTTLVRVARLNGLDPMKPLLIGTRLRIPGAVVRVAAVTTRTPAAATTANAAEIRDALGAWAARYGVDPRLARALSWMESGYQADVVSSVGAWGPMQLLDATWDYMTRYVIREPVERSALGNVRVGVAYLKLLLDEFGGDERLALAAWYQGARAVREHGVYAESKPFVANVLALRERM